MPWRKNRHVNVFQEIEDIFDNLIMNLHSVITIKENIEKLKKLNETIQEETIKKQILETINSVDLLLLKSDIKQRDIEIQNQYERAKEILFSVSIGALRDFQKELEKTNIDDFYIIELDYNNLTIAGTFDSCYYHEVELIFMQVEFLCCPKHFTASNFRIATKEEKIELERFSNQIGSGLTFCIEDKHSGDKHFIVAHGFKANWGTVFYYKRENLQPDEKIADWFVG